jgi:hypothetical protein
MKKAILFVVLMLLVSSLTFAVEGEQISHDLNSNFNDGDISQEEDDSTEFVSIPNREVLNEGWRNERTGGDDVGVESPGPTEFRSIPDRMVLNAPQATEDEDEDEDESPSPTEFRSIPDRMVLNAPQAAEENEVEESTSTTEFTIIPNREVLNDGAVNVRTDGDSMVVITYEETTVSFSEEQVNGFMSWFMDFFTN